MSTRSCASLSSPTAHMTFCTLDEVFLPQTLSIRRFLRGFFLDNRQTRRPLEKSIEPAGFFRQHDGDAVADRVGELCGARDQLLLGGVVFEWPLGQRAHENLQKFRIDGVGRAVTKRVAHGFAL